jgi:hypothetical protein
MGSRFTRHRFLKAAALAAAYLGLTGTVGSQSPQRSSKARSLSTSKVKPLPGVPLPPPDGVWAFRSRPDLKAPAVEVATQARDDTAPGYIFIAPEKGGAGKGGSMIIDDRAQVVWFHPLRGPYGRTMNFEAIRMAQYRACSHRRDLRQCLRRSLSRHRLLPHKLHRCRARQQPAHLCPRNLNPLQDRPQKR